jgi:alpha-ketoglutarate-dependent taurine dioxygenase
LSERGWRRFGFYTAKEKIQIQSMELTISTDRSEAFPGLIETTDASDAEEFVAAVKYQRPWLKQILSTHGALHFKGFQQTLESFNEFASALFPELDPFNPALPGVFARRGTLAKNVVDSTYLWKRVPMSVHNEYNYLPTFPRYIAFRCLKAPQQGGETAIADSRKIYDEIEPNTRSKFESKSIKYTRNFYDKRLVSTLMNKFVKLDESWKEVFRTEDPAEVEEVCRRHNTEFSWGRGNSLRICNVLPAVRVHPETNEKVWFNQAAPWVFHPQTTGWLKYVIYNFVYPQKGSKPISVSFGDGSEISPAEAAHIIGVIEKNTIKVKWSEGDTLLCDNYMVAHGRMPYKGERTLATVLR